MVAETATDKERSAYLAHHRFTPGHVRISMYGGSVDTARAGDRPGHSPAEPNLPGLLAMAREQIQLLQDALVEAATRPPSGEAERRLAIFSLFHRGLLTPKDVRRMTGMDQWEFSEYLGTHPEFQQVDIRAFLDAGAVT